MNKKKVSKIIAYVLLAAVLIMTAGLVLTFTRGGTTSFKTFYAEHNGKKLFGDEQLSLVPEEELRFDVKYTFDALVEEEEKDYSVSIITYGTKENQFTYTVNGQPYGFDKKTEVDVSEYFNLKKEEDHFTMELPKDFSMSAVLSRVHEGSMINVAESVDVCAGWYFAIKIQSYNEESIIILPFRQAPEEFDIDFSLKGVKADRKNPKVALGGYNKTELRFSFEDGFGPERLYVLVERCGSFDYTVEDGELIVTITDPSPGVKVTVTAIQQTYKLVADELVGVEPAKNNPDTIELGKSVLLTFQLKEGYELSTYDALGGTIRLEEQDGDTLIFKSSYEPEDYGDIYYCIYATPGDGASFPLEVAYTTGALTPSPANPQKVPVNGNVQLTFTVNPGYVVGRLVVTGADYDYAQANQSLTIFVSNPTANVVIGIETRPAYEITTNTTGVVENASNPTRLVDGSNAILYFSPMTGYVLPETVTVTNASYQWDQSTGKLELRDPAGPITVTVVAVKGGSGNQVITTNYTEGHIIPDPTNVPSIAEGTTVYLKFTISSDVDFGTVTATGATVSHRVSGQELTVTLSNPTGPVTVTITSRTIHTITTNLTHVSAASGNPTTVVDGLSAILYFTADSGYNLPTDVTVTNAQYVWTRATGKLFIREPGGPITITIEGVETVPERYTLTTSYTEKHLTPYPGNLDFIEEGATVELKFTISDNVKLGTVTATGATVSHSVSGQTLTVTLSNATGPVTVSIDSRPTYSITNYLSYVNAASDNPTTITDGTAATLYFTARSGYSLPAAVTVTGSGYQWNQSTGQLILREPTGPVAITITGVEIKSVGYDISAIYTTSHLAAHSSNPSVIEEGGTAELKFSISPNVKIGTVSSTGATASHTIAGQTLIVTLENPTGEVTLIISSRPYYSITTSLSHVTAAADNATTITDNTSETLYFTADAGYRLPAAVTVTGAGHQWDQSTGKLVLLNPTGAVTVKIVGAEILPESYAINPVYTTSHFTPYYSNPTVIAEGATVQLRFTIAANVELGTVSATGATVSHSVSGQLLTVTLENPTGPVTITITSRSFYKITTNLTYVSGASENPTTITDGTAVTLKFTARSGYSLPADVTVTNAQYLWNQSAGQLTIREPSGPVTIKITGVEIVPNSYAIQTSYTAGHFTADSSNPTSIQEGATVQLKFTISVNADFGTVTATGATVSHSVSDQVLTVTLKNPTGPITVTITSRPQFYITTNLSHVSAAAANANTIVDNSSVTLYFTADSGYSLPASVSVSGAGHQWTQSAGKLVLLNPTGPVTVTITGVENAPDNYAITTSYDTKHFEPYSSNPSFIEDGATVTLKFTISSDADFGTVTATGATVSHTVSGQLLTVTLKNPTGPVTVTITSRPLFSITTNLSDVSSDSSNPTTITDGSSATLYFTANSGYSLPASVTVSGAAHQWDQSAGKLELRDPTGPITVTVVGVQDPNARPAFDIQVTVIGALADGNNPAIIYDNSSATLYFTAKSGFYLPATVTVSGAGYQWDQTTGKLVLRDPTGPVTVEVLGVPDSGYIPFEEIDALPVAANEKLGER